MTDNPFLLYSLPVQGSHVTCLSLDDMFPVMEAMGQWNPQVKIVGLSAHQHRDKCLIYEQQVN